MTVTRLGLKIDVDTERGTRLGVPNLLNLFASLGIKATFLFSLGPDNTGRALKRIFRPGFFKKVSRTSVISTYGLKTLLNGILWPGPHIGNRHRDLIRSVQDGGHEVGIHCYDHILWQDNLHKMTFEDVKTQLVLAREVFENIFSKRVETYGSAGWQASPLSLQAYDELCLTYGSDTRGYSPFFPSVNGRVFKTLQIPTTLPTLDELLGRPEFPYENLARHIVSLVKPNHLNVFTLHAEMEGMKHLSWFKGFLNQCQALGIELATTSELAREALLNPSQVPVCEMIQGEVDGRTGTLALQG